jgi:hypothetical protein
MPIDWSEPLRKAKLHALPRPDATASAKDKKNYAERLSRGLAETIAEALRSKKTFRSITPTADGRGHEAQTRVDGGKKKLDVRLLNDELGLVFSASIKTYSFRDYSPSSGLFGRYQKNVVRNDMELRAEADVIHRRQPYAVMVAFFFMHEGATLDGENKHSSFAHAVFTFRKRAGRTSAQDERFDRFEKVYIGLFNPDNPVEGRAEFFDVENNPPRNGRPRQLLTLQEVVDEVDHLVKARNDLVYEYDDGAETDQVDLGSATAEDISRVVDASEE